MTVAKPVSLVQCRGCGKPFRRGNEWKDHKPACYPCRICGHGFPEKIAGCDCCEERL